jgi:hypothetical protein
MPADAAERPSSRGGPGSFPIENPTAAMSRSRYYAATDP